MQLKRSLKINFFVGIINKQKIYIIHPDFMVANQEITDRFIQNLKSNPNKVHDLTGEMNKSLKKQRLETSIKPKLHKVTRITDNNGKTKYLGRTYANNEVALEQSLICEKFELNEPDFYKQVTTVTCDETKHKNYIVPFGRCALNTSQDDPNFLDMHSNALTCLGESNKKEECVPDGPTIKYSQGIHNSCII